MKLTMIGTGYVGLVSGACFADYGHVVTCVDVDEAKIDALKRGEIPIYEPGLKEIVLRNAAQKRLSFTTKLAPAVAEADAVFIAVGTPSRRGDGHADLTYVYAAAREIAAALPQDRFVVVVTKSTVPVGTGDEIEAIIRAARPQAQVCVASNPEFLREGAAIEDFKRPDRVVVGVEDPRAEAALREIYRPLSLNQPPLLVVDRRTSELTKYAANAFLAMKITFINEIADLCEKAGADVQQVARGIGLDKRIGAKFLHAGPGYGGSCFPKDTRALVRTGEELGARVTLVERVEAINEARKAAMADRVIVAAGGDVAGKRVAVLGLAFKPNTDDMRDAPSLPLIAALQAAGADVHAHDPEAIEQARPLLSGVSLHQDPYEAIAGAHAAVLVTEWDAYRALDLARLRATMAEPVLVDLRNVYAPAEPRRHGLRYSSVGRR
jgi:UDPglucose 6-dehydrogenase